MVAVVNEDATPSVAPTADKGFDFEGFSPTFATGKGDECRMFAPHGYLCEFSLGEIQPNRIREMVWLRKLSYHYHYICAYQKRIGDASFSGREKDRMRPCSDALPKDEYLMEKVGDTGGQNDQKTTGAPKAKNRLVGGFFK